VSKEIRPAPDETERAKTGCVEHFQHPEIAVDRLRAFDVQYCRQRSLADAFPDCRYIAADAHRASRIALYPQQHRDELQRVVLRIGKLRLFGQRQIVFGRARALIDIRIHLARRDEDGEEPPGKPACSCPRQIELPRAVAIDEGFDAAVRLRFPRKPEEHVVVPVEDGKHSGIETRGWHAHILAD
jgi:hypothetical protein